MNTSIPVATEVASVDFNHLTVDDIRSLSVKQVVNPLTFAPAVLGSVPVPNPGGLYDPALGASESLRQRCTTCHLDHHHCPGHVGHIALPIPVFNPLFFDQLLRLVRGTCVYCFHFRLSRAEADRYACKLRLIQYGLLEEARTIDTMTMTTKSAKAQAAIAQAEGPGEDLEDLDNGDVDAFIARRRRFVEKAVRRRIKERYLDTATKTTAISDERRAVLRAFMGELTKARKCSRCQAFSPVFRADNYAKIFEKKLSSKQRTANSGLGLRRRQPALDRNKKLQEAASREDVVMEDAEETAEQEEELEEAERSEIATTTSDRLLPNIEVENLLIRLFENEQDLVRLVYAPRTVAAKNPKPVTPEIFFLHALAIPPTRFRPPQVAGGELTESTSNKALVKILQDCLAIRDHKKNQREGSTMDPMQRLMQAFVDLQQDVNAYIDSTKSPVQGMAAKGVEDGIKQKLEKKEGLFRKNMMGKRVNFAARSVISPDPNIETSEIGVPLVFATRLSYPEAVTDENYAKLSEYAKNGPDKWPGALAIEMENGTVQKLPGDSEFNAVKRREELAKLLQTPDPLMGDSRPKKVLRHLMNNDYVIMNRQPTLHKPSMMAHKARVLRKEKTIRMHYANCNTYNADFDGDEMNMHLPQNAVAQAEAREIAKTDLQYLAPTAGKPLRGLIQDHLSIAVNLCSRDTFFNRQEYHQLLYSSLLPETTGTLLGGGKSSRIKTLPPAIFRPRPLWTGKQVVTTILENIRPRFFDGLTLTSKSKVPGSRWYPGNEEDEVVFHRGYLASGILDKNQLGPSDFGFVHAIYEAYGPGVAGSLLSIMGRLLTKLLHMRAHTCGMDDLLLTPEGDARRRKTLDRSADVGRELSVEYVGLKEGEFKEAELHTRLEEVLRDENKQRTLDMKANASTKNFTSQVIRECLPDGLVKAFPKNSFQAMTVSGAKGSDVNASQISCLLGQQVLEGRRVPVMVSGKTLPCFKPYDTDVRAGGYITDRFLTGVRPQEFYFHCMAGREGLIDTAVKTSRSGYLQRCLIKGMEGMQVQYDNTVRDSDGSLVQFLYGEDALDITKQRYLNQFKFCSQNLSSLLRRVTEDTVNEDLMPSLERLATNLNYGKNVNKMVKKAFKKFQKKGDLAASEVTISEYSPAKYLGSVSEKFQENLDNYITRNPDNIIDKDERQFCGREMSKGVAKDAFRNLMAMKYVRAVIDPGESVGIVAGQSIGEPSTQMTLNTFHLAGHATKNVTLGIPRLREIVMTASASIATPTMTITLRPGVTEQEAATFVKRCSKLVLAEIIDTISVSETTTSSSKKFVIRLDLFPAKEYKEEYSLSKALVERILKTRFLRALERAVTGALNPKKAKGRGAAASDDALPEVGKSSGPGDEGIATTGATSGRGGDDDSDDDDDEGDATNNKIRSRKNETQGYDGPDEDEAEIARQNREESDVESEDEGVGASMSEGSDEEEDESVPKREVVMDLENVSSFEFDPKGAYCELRMEYPAESPKVLMLGIVEKVARETVIQQLPDIGSMAPVPSTELSPEQRAAGIRKLAVEGVNFPAIWQEADMVEMDTIETNDIACVLRTYGVEAARNNIIKEMNAVFGGHGISVDVRHLNLIADIMTRTGGFLPFNRQGMNSSTSPLMKMSFETTCNFLKDAALEGDFDDLNSPSARIVLGKLSGVGTGSFDVMVGGL